MDNTPSSTTFTWKIKKFSKSKKKKLYSDNFVAGGEKWNILVFPNGNEDDHHFSIYLSATDWMRLPIGWIKYVDYTLRLVNQIDAKKTISYEAFREFSSKYSQWGFKSFISLVELHDPKGGYIVKDTCILEAVVSVITEDDTKKKTGIEPNDSTEFEIQEAEEHPLRQNSPRTSSIAPPQENHLKPSSSLRNRSTIARTILQGFMSEFEEDFPTCEKFGKVMEDLRSTMYGGNMGDIFEEWRPRILETEALLAAIEDMEQECKDCNQEAPLWEKFSQLLESLSRFGQVSTQAEEKIAVSASMLEYKRQELHATQQKLAELRLQMVPLLAYERNIREDISTEESLHVKVATEKEEVDREIKNLNQEKEDVTKSIEDVQARFETRKTTIAEKKGLVQQWLSNPLAPPIMKG